jgi:hypothetical protein
LSKDILKERKHAFSIELDSSNYVKCISILNDSCDCILIEGYLGELEEISLIEGIMLEIKGTNGTLRMDLNEAELKKLLKKEGKES